MTPISMNALDNQVYGTPAKPKSDLDINTFMRLLTTQLANQNPLEPMKDADFYAQMAQLGTVDGIGKLQNSMELTQASAMIGKTVTAVRTLTDNGENSLVTGQVIKVSLQNGNRVITVQDNQNGGLVDVSLANVQSIQG